MENNESKNLNIRPPREILWAMVAFLAILVIFFIAKTANELSGYNRTSPIYTINVSGEGKVLVKPDVAVINVGILKDGTDLVAIQNSAAKVMDGVTSVLKSKGVSDKDIKTTSYNISPMYDYNNGVQKFRGYQISQNLEIKIRDLGKVGEILSAVANAGANQVGSLSFNVDDPKKAEADARNLAIQDAKAKAEILAQNLGVSLKKIVGFSESGGGVPPIMYAKAIGGIGIGGEAAAPPPTPTGENEINVSVNLQYEIR